MFHNQAPSMNATFTPAETALSYAMVDYWTSFAKTGDPNAGRLALLSKLIASAHCSNTAGSSRIQRFPMASLDP